MLLKGFHVQSTAPLCTHLCKPDPLLCCAWVCTGHPKSISLALRLQQFPRSKQAMDTGAASSHACSSHQTQPTCSEPHFLEPPGTSFSSLHPGTALALQEVPRARQGHADPHTQHLPMASNHAQSTHKPKHNTQLGLTLKLLCSEEPELTPQQAPHLQPAALSCSSCFITSSSSARCLCLPEKGPTAAEPAVTPTPLPPQSFGF